MSNEITQKGLCAAIMERATRSAQYNAAVKYLALRGIEFAPQEKTGTVDGIKVYGYLWDAPVARVVVQLANGVDPYVQVKHKAGAKPASTEYYYQIHIGPRRVAEWFGGDDAQARKKLAKLLSSAGELNLRDSFGWHQVQIDRVRTEVSGIVPATSPAVIESFSGETVDEFMRVYGTAAQRAKVAKLMGATEPKRTSSSRKQQISYKVFVKPKSERGEAVIWNDTSEYDNKYAVVGVEDSAGDVGVRFFATLSQARDHFARSKQRPGIYKLRETSPGVREVNLAEDDALNASEGLESPQPLVAILWHEGSDSYGRKVYSMPRAYRIFQQIAKERGGVSGGYSKTKTTILFGGDQVYTLRLDIESGDANGDALRKHLKSSVSYYADPANAKSFNQSEADWKRMYLAARGALVSWEIMTGANRSKIPEFGGGEKYTTPETSLSAEEQLTRYARSRYAQAQEMGQSSREAALILALTVGKQAKRLGMDEREASKWLQGAYGRVWVASGSSLTPGADLKEVSAEMLKAMGSAPTAATAPKGDYKHIVIAWAERGKVPIESTGDIRYDLGERPKLADAWFVKTVNWMNTGSREDLDKAFKHVSQQGWEFAQVREYPPLAINKTQPHYEDAAAVLAARIAEDVNGTIDDSRGKDRLVVIEGTRPTARARSAAPPAAPKKTPEQEEAEILAWAKKKIDDYYA